MFIISFFQFCHTELLTELQLYHHQFPLSDASTRNNQPGSLLDLLKVQNISLTWERPDIPACGMPDYQKKSK